MRRISNAAAKSVDSLDRTRQDTAGKLIAALDITEFTEAKVLEAANVRRATISLPAISVLETTTSLKDGITTIGGAAPVSKVPKAQAQTELKAVALALEELRSESFDEARAAAYVAAQNLVQDAALLAHVSREELLRSALDQFDGERCPVCNTEWTEDAFRAHVAAKLEAFKAATEKRALVEAECKPIVDALDAARTALQPLIEYGPLLTPPVDVKNLKEFQDQLAGWSDQIRKFLPLEKTIEALDATSDSTALDPTIDRLKVSITALPEPSAQDAARDYLIIAQEKLEAHRSAAHDLNAAKERAAKASKVCGVYADTTTGALETIYKDVEAAFSDLYREINKEDESSFTAQLKPTLGKLGFDVDFYGRGHFPPGAYHSEGAPGRHGLVPLLGSHVALAGQGLHLRRARRRADVR